MQRQSHISCVDDDDVTCRDILSNMGTNSYKKRLEMSGAEGISSEMSRRAKMRSHKPADSTTTRKRKKRCQKQAVVGGVCCTQGATRKKRSAEGCENQARVGGVCNQHGAGKKCSAEGCQKQAQIDCQKQAQMGGVFAMSTEPRARKGAQDGSRFELFYNGLMLHKHTESDNCFIHLGGVP